MQVQTLADNGLTPAEERLATLLARGYSPRQAYALSHGKNGVGAESLATRAANLAAMDKIRARVRAILRAAKIDDLDSVAQYHADLMRQIALAVSENNLTAAAALMRLRGQTIGVLQDKTIITDERSFSDSALVECLAKGDPHKTSMLQAILGNSEAYKN